jgi:hypothetical protein
MQSTPPRVSSPSALDEAETRFDRPLMLSWEEQRKLISLRDSPKKYPIPKSPMKMKARMSAFEVKQGLSTPPFVKKPPLGKKAFQPKRAFLSPPLADFPSSEDALAETPVSLVLVADEFSACDASTTSHTVPITLEDDSFGEDQALVISESLSDTLVMEKTCNYGDSDDDDSDTDSHDYSDTDSHDYSDTDSDDSQLDDSFQLPEVYQEDGSKAKSCGKAGKSKKCRFDSDSDDSDSDDEAGTKPKKEKKWRTFEKEQARKNKGKPGKCKKGRFDSDSDDSDSDDEAGTKPKKESKWRAVEKEETRKKKEEEKKQARFDRPLTLSWEEQEKVSSLRNSPKKFPIPASPMKMKDRMSAFEVKPALSAPPFARKSPISSFSSAKKASKGSKTQIPPPPLVDSSNSGDALAETTVSPALAVEETVVFDANMTSHAAPPINEDDCCGEDALVSTSVISHSSNDAAAVKETCNVGGAGKTVQAISSESYHDDDSGTDSHDSQLADSFELPEVYQEDEKPETRFDRPLTLSWKEQRKLISLRDSPKKYPIPASPMNMKARMSAFEMKQALSAPPLAGKDSI